MNNYVKKKYSYKTSFKFILPSLLGVILFMFPIKIGNKITIPIALLSDFIQDRYFSSLPLIVLGLVEFPSLEVLLLFLCFVIVRVV